MPLSGEYAPSPTDWVRQQVEEIEARGDTVGTTVREMPVVLLTYLGGKSGKLHKTPLMRVEHDGTYAIVASKGGAPSHPTWYHSLVANPHVELRDGRVQRDYTAREVSGDEKATWWERAVAAFPDYADYQRNTTRQIPVFVLEPLDEG